jgi:hypothetical protein
MLLILHTQIRDSRMLALFQRVARAAKDDFAASLNILLPPLESRFNVRDCMKAGNYPG